jgi:hypothetical protein
MAFSEQHRQYFHTDDEVGALLDAGFVLTVSEEYTHRPVEPATTLCDACPA